MSDPKENGQIDPETLCTSFGCGKPLDDPVHQDEFGCWCSPDNHDPHCHYVGIPTMEET